MKIIMKMLIFHFHIALPVCYSAEVEKNVLDERKTENLVLDLNTIVVIKNRDGTGFIRLMDSPKMIENGKAGFRQATVEVVIIGADAFYQKTIICGIEYVKKQEDDSFLVEIRKGSLRVKEGPIHFEWFYRDKNSIYLTIDSIYSPKLLKKIDQ
jgi:hypothetical protein